MMLLGGDCSHLHEITRRILSDIPSKYGYFPMKRELGIDGYSTNQQKLSTILQNSCLFADELPKNVKENSKDVKDNAIDNIVKGQWSLQEDSKLKDLVETYGVKKWCVIAKLLGNRVGKQCRERWHNHLRPNNRKDEWRYEEDLILIEAHKEMGSKWSEIVKRLPGRTENSIKNHWNSTKRKSISLHKGRRKLQSTTPLLKYIMSIENSALVPLKKQEEISKCSLIEEHPSKEDFLSYDAQFMNHLFPSNNGLWEQSTSNFEPHVLPYDLENMLIDMKDNDMDLIEMLGSN